MAKLDIKAFGLACGILWAAAMFILGMMNLLLDWGSALTELMGSVYIGYRPTFLGSLVGAVWGFVDGGVAGLLLAWLYNKIAKN